MESKTLTSLLHKMEWKQGSDFSIAYFDIKEQVPRLTFAANRI